MAKMQLFENNVTAPPPIKLVPFYFLNEQKKNLKSVHCQKAFSTETLTTLTSVLFLVWTSHLLYN